jgi:hypothetical protein
MENSIDKLTLELLINKQHYSKYLSKTDPKKHDEYKEYKSKLRKYSVDIIDITSQLIENPKKMFSTEIEESFSCYIKSIFKHFEIKELEKSNEYNHNGYKNEDDEDVLFGNCDNNNLLQGQENAQEDNAENEADTEEQDSSPMMKSFWGKEKVIKQSSSIPYYDMNMFHKKSYK